MGLLWSRADAEVRKKKSKPKEGWAVTAFREAVSEGLSPSDFWEMTPYLTGTAMDALYDLRIKQGWIVAGLMRQKKLPELKKLLSKKPVDTKQRMNELKAALAARSKIGG